MIVYFEFKTLTVLLKKKKKKKRKKERKEKKIKKEKKGNVKQFSFLFENYFCKIYLLTCSYFIYKK